MGSLAPSCAISGHTKAQAMNPQRYVMQLEYNLHRAGSYRLYKI